MSIKDIINLINISACYFLLIISLPSFILKPKVIEEKIFKRFIIYLVFGNFYISTIIFILSYLNIFNRMVSIISISVLSIILRVALDREGFKTSVLKFKRTLEDLLLGTYGINNLLYVKSKAIKERIMVFIHELFTNKKIEWLIFIAIIIYNIYQYGINSVRLSTYMAPDEEVHLYWIQSLLEGNIFPEGVYPHMFHNIMGAIIKIFNINALVVMRYFGMISTTLIMTSLYIGLRKIFKSRYPALFGFLLYSILDIYSFEATYRFQFTIPQEYGMIVLMPMAIFLFDYIKDKKNIDLIFLGLSLSLSIGIHFYTGIIAIILIFSMLIVRLKQIIREKILIKILLTGLLSGMIAIAPLAAGLAMGFEMEQSMNWAAEVIKGDIYESSEVEGGKEVDQEKPKGQPLKLSKVKMDAKRHINKHVVNNINTIYILLVIMLVSMILNIVFYKKDKEKNSYKISFAINSFILVFLMLFRALKLPTIMEAKRLAIYFAYFSPIFLGMPLEFLIEKLKDKKLSRVIPLLSISIMGISVYLVISQNYLRPIPPIYYFQTTGTMRTNIQIMEDYKDYTWTAVSPVNNISGILNYGFHYELSDFIKSQENWNKNKSLIIPTEYVFIYIEKRPIKKFGFRFEPDAPEITSREEIRKEDAYKEFSEEKIANYTYEKERDILMAKAYYWAQEYKKYFPREMNIYYEDSELIVYRIRQNMYALNNLSIDYGMNRK